MDDEHDGLDDGKCIECGADLPEHVGQWLPSPLCEEHDRRFQAEIESYLDFIAACRSA